MDMKNLCLKSLRKMKDDIKDEIEKKMIIMDEYLFNEISKLKISKKFKTFKTFLGFVEFIKSDRKSLLLWKDKIIFHFKSKVNLYTVEFDLDLKIINLYGIKEGISYPYNTKNLTIFQDDDYFTSKIKKMLPCIKELLEFNYFLLYQALEDTNILDVLNVIKLIRRFRHSQLSRLNKDEFSLLLKAIQLSYLKN